MNTLLTSNVLCFWVSDDLSNNVWGQVGYYVMDDGSPTAFYQIWNLNTNAILVSGMTTVTTGIHSFSMYLQSGTTWAFALDGSVFGTYNMGASSSSTSYPVYALSEEQASAVFSFPAVTFGPALQVLRSGTWTDVVSAKSYGSGWGVQGNLQNPLLPSDEIIIGGSLVPVQAGTLLWGSSSSTSTMASSTTTHSTTTSTSKTSSTTTKSSTTSTSTTKISSTTTTTSPKVVSVAWGYAPTTVTAGSYAQWLAVINTSPGSSGVGVAVSWYLDGVLRSTGSTGKSGNSLVNQGWDYFSVGGLTAGTHALYFVAGGLKSSTLTITSSATGAA